MAKCKCGKELLQDEKKCDRCKNKGREKRKKILTVAIPVVASLGVGIKKYGPMLIKMVLKK